MEKNSYLISISFSVCASLTIRRIHGGGVIGLRSWTPSANTQSEKKTSKHRTHLVTKTAHSSTDGLLHHMERPDAAFVLRRHRGEMVDGAARGLRPIGRGLGVHAIHRGRRDAIHRQRRRRWRDLMGSVLLHGVHGSRRRYRGRRWEDGVFIYPSFADPLLPGVRYDMRRGRIQTSRGGVKNSRAAARARLVA